MNKINFTKKILIILSLILFNCNLFANNYDSLKFIYYKSEGKAKLDALYFLIKELRHDHLIEALTYEQEAERLFSEVKYPEAEAKILGQFAFCHINKAEFEIAFKQLQRAYNIASKLSDKGILAEVENNLGVANYFIGNYSMAAEYLLNSYKTRVELGNKSDIANTANNLGLVFTQIMELKKAQEYYLISLKLKKEIGDNFGIIRTLSNICDVYLKKNDLENAKKYFEEGLLLSEKSNYQNGIAVLANLGGRIYTILKDYEKALYYYSKAKDIYHLRLERTGELQALNNIAEVYLLTNNYSAAYQYLKDALTLKGEIKQETVFLKTYLLLSIYNEKLGNYSKALEYARIYDEIKDTIFNESKARQIRELSAGYELEKKQRQIDLLNKEKIIRELDSERSLYIKYLLVLLLIIFAILIIGLNYRNIVLIKNRKVLEDLNSEILAQKNKLAELNKTQNTLLKIIAHDLRNPFNVLIGFSDALLKLWDSMDEKEKLDLIQDINLASKNSFLLLENLLDWAINKIGGKEVQPENIKLKKFIEDCIGGLRIYADKKNIKINILIDDDTEITADYNMLNTVIRNIFSNSIKFAQFGGNITIKSTNNDDEYVTIEIIDDGIGMSEDLINKKLNQDDFETLAGTNNEKGSGLGLMLCKELVSKNKGKFNIHGEKGVGTTVSISMPKAK